MPTERHANVSVPGSANELALNTRLILDGPLNTFVTGLTRLPKRIFEIETPRSSQLANSVVRRSQKHEPNFRLSRIGNEHFDN